MKPLKLTMQAFGSYGNKVTIDFTTPRQNLFLITGDTGSGKSTIFDGITFALYGESSSMKNTRSGEELRSQFADLALTPEVSLTFSQGSGGGVYTVRRVLRHRRQGRGGQLNKTQDSEKASLVLPDGTEIVRRDEVNRAIIEIIGLTKEQFRQVGMIAQGEYMELLREKTNSKKEIFRRLFGTEIFTEIVERVKQRYDEKATRIQNMQISWAERAMRASIPEDYEKAAILKEALQGQTVVQMEAALALLSELIREQTQKLEAMKPELAACKEKAERSSDIYSKAQVLSQNFNALETAKTNLESLARKQNAINRQERLCLDLEQAFELQRLFEQYQQNQSEVRITRSKLEEQRKQLPELSMAVQRWQSSAREAQAVWEKCHEQRTRIEEQVKETLDALSQIQTASSRLTETQTQLQKSRRQREQCDQRLTELAAREETARKQREKLQKVPAQLVQLENREQQWLAWLKEEAALQKEEGEIKSVYQEIAALQAKVRQINANYRQQNEAYGQLRNRFYAMQAGILARDSLSPGKPCPVCGSLEHPSPCPVPAEDRGITRETLEKAEVNVNRLKEEQEKYTKEIQGKQGIALEKERQYGQRKSEWEKQLQSITLSRDAYEQELRKQKAELSKQQRELEEAERMLGSVSQKRQKLQKDKENVAAQEQQSQTAISACKAILENQRKRLRYPSREAAQQAKEQAEYAEQRADKQRVNSEQALKAEQEKLNTSQTLEQEYTKALPALWEKEANSHNAYVRAMENQALTEAAWQKLARQYTQNQKKSLEQEVKAYYQEKSRLEGALKTAKEATSGQEKPDLDALFEQKESCEAAYQQVSEHVRTLQSRQNTNQEVYNNLSGVLQERGASMQAYDRLKNLYQKLAGKEKGGHMDLETFVQRQYLEQILAAANQRFREMSGGEFELCLYDLENAGEGSNKGLDLMVYSSVTGQKREVTTLSGGESFMAALSLALGMADSITDSQAQSSLDMMFLDEGFGSLDDHARGHAVRVLKEMAGSEKLIGIISHVTELKQDIEDQLVVTKDQNGSHVKWRLS